jgi:hypothetical protein
MSSKSADNPGKMDSQTPYALNLQTMAHAILGTISFLAILYTHIVS